MAKIKGTKRDDFIHVRGDGNVPPSGSNEIAKATDGADKIKAGRGDDTIFGGGGDDVATFNISTDGADAIDLGSGADVIEVGGKASEVRLTFTSAEVGNGSATDSNTLANQDGGLAVRMQAENKNGELKGPVTRTDDEGVTFVAGKGTTFDVRDLVSGVERGAEFEVVTLGTQASETLSAVHPSRPYYINAGMGDDTVFGGTANDFLVGGAGADILQGAMGDDSFIGGGGNDTIMGGKGDDTAIFANIAADGADQVNLGKGDDTVVVNAAVPTEVRLTFTSAEVGNGVELDSDTLANQDGGFAVRMQAEDGSDGLTGAVSRIEDESVTFVAGAGVKFDVRDLVSGTARGDDFEVVTLGSKNDDTLEAVQNERPYYINAGMGDDTVTGGEAADFLVGGAGNDVLDGGKGADSFIGGLGADTFHFSTKLGSGNVDALLDFSALDDTISLDKGVFKGIGKGDLDDDAFVIGTEATNGDHRIIYDQASGTLFYDRDGSGGKYDAVAFAKVAAGTALTEDDFLIA
ncbi:calcium-binding protein [Methylopila sp. M107]|uniref:calcium-binding protein n=1 Tax=Methylopila sp. M107 TaxID=1101190 RepID=UPI00036FE765|nr:calcium-binding protein [Methylopila sp. M107]